MLEQSQCRENVANFMSPIWSVGIRVVWCGGRSPPDHLTRVESGEVVDGDKAAVFADQPKTTTIH